MQTAYEYGYGFDGKRRWRKDYTQSPTLWTWYPCGVGCEAGDLVEQTSINGGTTWTTSALYLRGLGLIRRRNVATSADEYHHFDLRDTVQLITDSNGTVKLSELYDRFNVRRYAVSGGAFSQWRWQNRYLGEEGMVANCWIAIDRDLALQRNCRKKNDPCAPCRNLKGMRRHKCLIACGGIPADDPEDEVISRDCARKAHMSCSGLIGQGGSAYWYCFVALYGFCIYYESENP